MGERPRCSRGYRHHVRAITRRDTNGRGGNRTSSDWNNYLSTIYGTGDPRVTGLKAQVLATPAGAPLLVYDTYDWVPSETRELPLDDFDPGPGEWVVVDDHGNAVARFADLDKRD